MTPILARAAIAAALLPALVAVAPPAGAQATRPGDTVIYDRDGRAWVFDPNFGRYVRTIDPLTVPPSLGLPRPDSGLRRTPESGDDGGDDRPGGTPTTGITLPQTAATPSQDGPVRLVGTPWTVVSLAGTAPVERTRLSLRITGRGEAHGSGGCNNFRAPVETGEGSLSFGQVASTRKACPEALMEQESRYLGALARVDRWEITGGRLVLKDAAGADLMTLAAATD